MYIVFLNMKFVDVKTVKSLLEKGEIILIDVREPIEHAVEHIKGSISIPLSLLSHEKIPLDATKKVVFYCKGGVRGGSACSKIAIEASNMEGGIEAWKKEGFETIKSGKRVLPIERQMQLIAGLFIFIFTILGAFVNSKFLFVPGFFGIGLTFAGLTGFCGLIKFLSLLPWNKV